MTQEILPPLSAPDDDCMKILAASAMIVGGDERLMLSGVIEIPARCVVRGAWCGLCGWRKQGGQ